MKRVKKLQVMKFTFSVPQCPYWETRTSTGFASRSFFILCKERGINLVTPLVLLVVVALVLFSAYSSGFHDGANVMATIIMTKALSRKKALLMVVACELIAPFFLGTAVAKVIGKDIMNFSAFKQRAFLVPAAFIIASLMGAIVWNLTTWASGFPSSSSHALVGGNV
jgi:phosphate/sulfate permease